MSTGIEEGACWFLLMMNIVGILTLGVGCIDGDCEVLGANHGQIFWLGYFMVKVARQVMMSNVLTN